MKTITSDGTEYPFAKDLNDVWHRRPRGGHWQPAPAKFQCRTICGRAIASTTTANFKPGGTAQLCAGCFPGDASAS